MLTFAFFAASWSSSIGSGSGTGSGCLALGLGASVPRFMAARTHPAGESSCEHCASSYTQQGACAARACAWVRA
eukprot:210380-Prorocentrum_minimum.AAC.2